jgi:PIN domain nuclease of toxin-antitoxin system
MYLLDTMVLIGSLDPDSPLHKRAIRHLQRVSAEEVYVPSAAILEMDLELKTHGFSKDERQEACASLLGYVGEEKILPLTFAMVSEAVGLEKVAGYFDSLIGSTAKLREATIISKDRAFQEMGLKTEW